MRKGSEKMHLATLMTNTDDSVFAQAHPKDGEKFAALIHSVRPGWQVTSFDVKDGVFPKDINAFDGVMITGSPASVLDDAPWVARLLQVIREAYAAETPLFGACYGHQAIALALGGEIGPNPDGWVFGLTHSTVTETAPWMEGLPRQFPQYGAHMEAVVRLPEGARVLSTSDACEITGFRIGDTVYTTQNHPEMTPQFIAALVAEYQDKLPDGVGAAAVASLTQDVDMAIYGETIARFFEGASAD
ncbi:type 1 glutamine amidotransferase [Jannaschia sp. CCS1]|uniref:type 1 glutamine amidotransferase n=1 Tax=Jannaschia sp. (strain CCS1) TaxID=290400 RepID=UPI00006C0089|nr:type 1 glutamine amidotransferase [Jannaschia sp. CCS1]ABD55833.1 glutamine amidotransferase class-I [Jannaschia sp. CCS1]